MAGLVVLPVAGADIKLAPDFLVLLAHFAHAGFGFRLAHTRSS